MITSLFVDTGFVFCVSGCANRWQHLYHIFAVSVFHANNEVLNLQTEEVSVECIQFNRDLTTVPTCSDIYR